MTACPRWVAVDNPAHPPDSFGRFPLDRPVCPSFQSFPNQRGSACLQEELRSLPNGTQFSFEWGAGDPPQRAFMEFIGEDGRLIRYYGLVFE